MKKLIITLSLIISLTLVATKIITAQDDDNTATDSVNQEVTDNLKQRMQDSIKGITEETINEITEQQTTEPRAFVGTVKDMIQETVTIATKDGIRYATPNTEEVTILRSPGNSEIDPEDIQIDDYIIAMGYLTSQDNLDAKRIIVSKELTTTLNKMSGFGVINDLSDDIISISHKDAVTELEVDSDTIFKSKTEVIDQDDLSKDMKILYTATTNSNNKITATIVMTLSDVEQDLTEEE